MLTIDGSMMEGGGQLLRMATTYSAILDKPIKVIKIREKRKDPGLKPQHLTTLMALTKICNAETIGAYLGSNEIEFTAGEIKGGHYNFDIGTAGSISLFLQCIAPVLSFADKATKIRVIGGTNVNWSPPISIVEKVIWKGLKLMNFKGSLKIIKEGFYPKGNGIVEVDIMPISNFTNLKAINPKIETIRGLSLSGKLPEHIAERQADSAKKMLFDSGYDSDIEIIRPNKNNESLSPGSVISLWTDGDCLIGADCLGERGKTAEKVGSEAAAKIINEIKTGAYVDQHTSDNLIMPFSLANGESVMTVSKLTNHTLTAINLSKIMTNSEFKVVGRKDEPGKIFCQGIKMYNKYLKN